MMAQSMALHNRRRDKPVLSCTFCRGRKLRCDRQSPCSACATRGKAAHCIYSTSEQERKDAIDYRPHSHTRSQHARQRLARLENLVTELRDREGAQEVLSAPAVSSASSGDPILRNEMEKLSFNENSEVYTGSSHWMTILEDIQHLKDELPEEFQDRDSSLATDSPDIMRDDSFSLLHSAPRLSKNQVLSLVPLRKVVDRHVSHFFNAFDMGSFIIHRNTFLAEYADFWNNPSDTPTMWIALLFSIMSMSALLQQQDLRTPSPQDMLGNYRTLTIQSLIAADYLKPSRHTTEALILHFAVDQKLRSDTSIENWILIGVVIRLALRMGLHRDPSHWPNIRPLQAELRRRHWMTLYQMDFFTSTQVGLPRIIKDSQCDARAPGHFFDHDINLADLELPPERHLTETTPLLYVILRHSIIKVASEIYDATEAGPPSPGTMIALEAKLQSAVEAIPTWLRYRSIESSLADNPVTVQHQMSLDILIHKAVYLLHRRSFIKGASGEESKTSNELCIKAALAILEHQQRIHEETQPGGLLFDVRWKVVSLNQEFLQATMMLCFVLSKLGQSSTETANSGALEKRDGIIEALLIAKSLWEKEIDMSVDARRAARAITLVLQQDKDRPGNTVSLTASFGLPDERSGAPGDSYFGSFDYGQDMALDPSLFAIDEDLTDFVNLANDFTGS